MYDMRSVAEKTSRSAYQVRLRLYVIGPGAFTTPKRQRWRHLPQEHTPFGTYWMGDSSCHRTRWMDRAVFLWLTRSSRSLEASRRSSGKADPASWYAPLAESVGDRSASGDSGWLVWPLPPLDASSCRALETSCTSGWPAGSAARKGGVVFGEASVSCPGNSLKHRVVRVWHEHQEGKRQQARRKRLLARLIAAYRQYHLASGNYFVPRQVRTRRARRWLNKDTWWKGVARSRHLIDVEALAALWHIPTDATLPDLARFRLPT